MKREIKFRAWDGKTMSYQQENGWFHPNIDTKTHKNQTVRLDCVIGDETLIPMQYTGLKDKNGVEIYEGDIVHSSYEIQGTEDGQEFFNTGKYKHDFYKVVEFKDGAFWSGSLMKGKTHEVIGNIYENPELL